MRVSAVLSMPILLLAATGCGTVEKRASLPGCIGASLRGDDCPAVVGTWIVQDDKGPFPVQLYVFNGDGTMQQSNPDAGRAGFSDSDGHGVWRMDGGTVRGKWVEVTANRETRRFNGHGEISFALTVAGDGFTGSSTVRFFDPEGKPQGEPVATRLTGTRIKLD